jgi:hypothetical protein
MESVVCLGVFHSIPFCLQSFTCKCSLQWIILWSGLRPLVSTTLSILDPHWDSSWTSCCCCDGDLAGLDQQDWSLHVLQQFIDGVDVGLGRLRGLDLVLGRSWIGQISMPLTPKSACQVRVGLPFLLSSPQARGRAGSTSGVLQLVRGGASSLESIFIQRTMWCDYLSGIGIKSWRLSFQHMGLL